MDANERKKSLRKRKRSSVAGVEDDGVDQAVLDDYEFGFQSMCIRNILTAANHDERLKKKEAKSSTNPRDQEDDQASEKFTSTFPLYNYRSFTCKSPRAKWSKQDTEKFYEALREFGQVYSMIQQVFPGKTKRQISLKFKNEDRHHPLRITDAIKSRSTDHHLSKSMIAKLQQNSTTNANQEATEDMSPGINEDPMAYHSLEQSDDSDVVDMREWFQYQSNI